MGAVAIDPADIVNEVEAAGKPITDPAPLLLSAPLEADPAVSPLRGSAELEEMHLRWANQGPSVGNATDLELVGSLIRAVDAVAARTDEISDRLRRTQEHLDELMAVLSEDLTRIRAILSTGRPQSTDA